MLVFQKSNTNYKFNIQRKQNEEFARLLQWLVFFRQFNSIGPLFCSFVQHHQLELRTSKTNSKRWNLVQNKNIDVQNLENRIPLVFSLAFFSAVCNVLVSPLLVLIIRNTMDVKKSQRPPSHTFFGTVTLILFKNLN